MDPASEGSRPPEPPVEDSRDLSWPSALAVVAVLGLAGALAMPALLRCNRCGTGMRCTNNLKSIGLAAIQYSDDRRYFPHVAKLSELDRDVVSSDGPRALRSLMYFNIVDDPEVFVCPGTTDDSRDRACLVSPAAKRNARVWGWGGRDETAAESPLVKRGASDGPLPLLHDLSYGWTRRGYTTNSSSGSVLAGDRTIRAPEGRSNPYDIEGNHRDCAIVVCIDAHTRRLTNDGRDEPEATTADLAVFWNAAK
jgi:hypothetical protein